MRQVLSHISYCFSRKCATIMCRCICCRITFLPKYIQWVDPCTCLSAQPLRTLAHACKTLTVCSSSDNVACRISTAFQPQSINESAISHMLPSAAGISSSDRASLLPRSIFDYIPLYVPSTSRRQYRILTAVAI